MFKEISGRDLFIIEGGKKNPVWKFFEGIEGISKVWGK